MPWKNPNATKDELKKKLNSLRTNFRKEIKKVNDSEKSATKGVYQPSFTMAVSSIVTRESSAEQMKVFHQHIDENIDAICGQRNFHQLIDTIYCFNWIDRPRAPLLPQEYWETLTKFSFILVENRSTMDEHSFCEIIISQKLKAPISYNYSYTKFSQTSYWRTDRLIARTATLKSDVSSQGHASGQRGHAAPENFL